MRDLTAVAQVEVRGSYAAAEINFRLNANRVWATKEAKQAMEGKILADWIAYVLLKVIQA